jgi:hypothetical protein
MREQGAPVLLGFKYLYGREGLEGKKGLREP